jgi:hypothetical protein
MQVLVPDQSRIGGRRGDQRDAPAAYGGGGSTTQSAVNSVRSARFALAFSIVSAY